MRPGARLRALLWFVLLIGAIAPALAQDIAAGERKYGICASCHGIEGRSFKPHYPILAGQNARYLLRQLQDFKEHRRGDPNMDAVVTALSAQDMRDLAEFFASRKPGFGGFKADRSRAARGRIRTRAASCGKCHTGNGASTVSAFPQVFGQHRDYVVKQLLDFRDGRRTNDGGVMGQIAQGMTDAYIDDLGNYLAGLPDR